MIKTISTWKPWNLGKIPQAVDRLLPYGENVCIKAVDGVWLYGTNTWTKIVFGGTQVDFENALKAKGRTVSFWAVPYFHSWAVEADNIRKAVDLYNPTFVNLDIERFQGLTNYDESGMIRNVGAFLRRLGRLPTKVYFQGPRRIYNTAGGPYHPEVQAEKFLSYKDLNTDEYIVDGIAAQLYPLGWNGEANFVEQTRLDVDSQELLLSRVGRPGLPYFPTLAAFPEKVSGILWKPTAAALEAQVEYLKDRLGDRLVGINFWTGDYMDDLQDVFDWIRDVDLGGGAVPPVPPADDLVTWAKKAEEYRHRTLIYLRGAGDLVDMDPGQAPEGV